jgi:WD40 repeat protein
VQRPKDRIVEPRDVRLGLFWNILIGRVVDFDEGDKMADSEHGLPEGFGKQETKENDHLIEGRYEKARRKEYVERLNNGGGKEDSADSDSDNSDEDNELDDLPTTHQLVLRGHTKSVSSISLDPSGSRLLTGSYDCMFKYWDFAGMDSIALNPFRSFEPLETHRVLTSAFSASGRSVLAVAQSLKPKLYTRDGKELGEFASGYVYLVDMKNTKGHTADMTGGAWNPVDNDTFCTSSVDSTIRIWDANRFNSQKSVIVVKPVKGGNKNKVTATGWSLDGKLVVGASVDGTFTTWDTKGPLLRPSHTIKEATVSNTWTSGITASPDGNMYAVRGGDKSLKLWDLRNPKTPVLQRLNLANDTETKQRNLQSRRCPSAHRNLRWPTARPR